MWGNANWLTGFSFSVSCFQGWSIWTELLCSTSLSSVECQCSGTTVSLPSQHSKSTASLETNVSLLSTRPPATPSMDSDRWNSHFCVCFCTALSSEPWMSASSPSLTQPLLSIACISAPLGAAEPFPWRGWALVLPCRVWAAPSCAGCNAHGTAFSMEYLLDTGTLGGVSLSHPAFPAPSTSAAALDRSQLFD